MAAGEEDQAAPFLRELAGHAKEVMEGRAEPAVPRDAATVMLVRPAGGAGQPAGGGFEVYMLKRQSSMKFAPGAYVFPGGSVDPRDAEADLAWTGPDAAEWGRLLGVPPGPARALVCAAVRETFEESGVLLAGPSPDEVVADTTAEDWEADRHALLDRSQSLAGLLTIGAATTPGSSPRRCRPASGPGTWAARPPGWPGSGPPTRSPRASAGRSS